MTCPITTFPETPLYDEDVQNGWLSKDFKREKWNIKAIINTPDMTSDEIQELVDESYGHFYNDIGFFSLERKC